MNFGDACEVFRIEMKRNNHVTEYKPVSCTAMRWKLKGTTNYRSEWSPTLCNIQGTANATVTVTFMVMIKSESLLWFRYYITVRDARSKYPHVQPHCDEWYNEWYHEWDTINYLQYDLGLHRFAKLIDELLVRIVHMICCLFLQNSLNRYCATTSSHHITSHHITSHHITSHHITSHHITSHHVTSHHITSHHITLRYTTLHWATSSCAEQCTVTSVQQRTSMRACNHLNLLELSVFAIHCVASSAFSANTTATE